MIIVSKCAFLILLLVFLTFFSSTINAQETISPPRIFNEIGTVVVIKDASILDMSWKIKEVVGMVARVHTIKLIGVRALPADVSLEAVRKFQETAFKRLRKSLQGQVLRLQLDPSQSVQDAEERLLRYAWLEDDRLVNLLLIQNGYAFYIPSQSPQKYQQALQQAQEEAWKKKTGLWGISGLFGEEGVCNIKGIISTQGKKSYLKPDNPLYSRNEIDLAKGEQWFCSEQEARTAGWEPM